MTCPKSATGSFPAQKTNESGGGEFKKFNTITFSNGFAKDRDQFQIQLKGIEIGEGKPEWGATPGVKYFVLKLGKVINTQNT